MSGKKWLVVFSFMFLFQQVCAGPKYAFRITFIDKKGSPSLSESRQYFTPRALERRAKHGIGFDEKDRPVSPVYLANVLQHTSGTIHLTSKWLNSCVIWLEDSSNIAALEQEPYIATVTYVSYDSDMLPQQQQKHTGIQQYNTTTKFKTTSDPAYYGSSWEQTDFVNGDCLHDKGRTGDGMLIAVLDDGFHYVNTAPAFDSVYDSGRIVATRNYVQGGSDVYTDFLTHGTSVLSTIAANIPNIYVGAAPYARFALYATENAASETPVEMDNMVAAFEHADSIGADIISASLGYNTFDAPFPPITPAQMDGNTTVAAVGVNVASQKGILVVMTAGNEGSNGLLTPGDATSALTVGNVTNAKVPASNSGYGPNASNQTKPEVCALGQPGWVITGSLSPFQSSGTSISTPQIAGWAACLWQASPGKTNSQIKQAIIESGDLYPTPQDVQRGFGVPDFCKADVILDIPVIPKAVSARVFPNPYTEKVFLELESPAISPVDVILTDITGKLIYKARPTVTVGYNKLTIDPPAYLTPGIYLLKFSIEQQHFFVKLIKN